METGTAADAFVSTKILVIRLAIATAIAWNVSVACAQSAPVEASGAVKDRSVPGVSLSAQRLLFANSRAAVPVSPSAEHQWTAPPPASTPYGSPQAFLRQFPSDVKEMQARLNAERNKYLSDRRSADNASIFVSSATLTLQPVAFDMALGGAVMPAAAMSASLTVATVMVDMYSKSISEQYKNTASEMYASVLRDLKSKDPDAFKAVSQGVRSDSPDKQREALATLLGARGSFLAGTELGNLPSAEAEAALPFFVDALKEGLAAERMKSAEEISKVRGKVQTVEKALVGFRTEVTNRINGLKTRIEESGQAISRLDQRVSSLDSSLKVTNAVLFDSLNPKAKLAALQSGLDIGLSASEREKVLENLRNDVTKQERLDAVQRIRSTATETLQVAGAVANLAQQAGVPVSNDVFVALDTGMKVVNVAAAFSMGPVSGILALSGALPGGGGQPSRPDPETLRVLADIQSKLREVIDLQRQTLGKLDELDRKITAQHFEVMKLLGSVASDVSRLREEADDSADSRLQQCFDFHNRLEFEIDKNPSRPHYETAQAVLKNIDAQKAYRDCNEFLRERFQIATGAPDWYLRVRFRDNAKIVGAPHERSNTHRSAWRPVFEFASLELGLAQDSVCARRLMQLWGKGPTSFKGWDPATDTCEALALQNVPAFELHLGGSPPPSFERLLGDYVHHDATLPGSAGVPGQYGLLTTLIGEQVKLAPYIELSNSENGTLPDINKIRARSPETTPDIVLRLRSVLDIVSVSLMQEALMSGAPFVHKLKNHLQSALAKNEFGFNPTAADPLGLPKGAVGSLSGADLEKAESCGLGSGTKIEAAHVLCLLEKHPHMLANTLAYWMSGIVGPGSEKTDVTVYSTMTESASLTFAQKVMPSLNWTLDRDKQFGFVFVDSIRANTFAPRAGMNDPSALKIGFYLKMHRRDGSLWYTPLPGHFEVTEQPIRYRPQARALYSARELALQELERHEVIRPSGKVPAVKPRLAATIALNDAKMAARARALRAVP